MAEAGGHGYAEAYGLAQVAEHVSTCLHGSLSLPWTHLNGSG